MADAHVCSRTKVIFAWENTVSWNSLDQKLLLKKILCSLALKKLWNDVSNSIAGVDFLGVIFIIGTSPL